MSANRHWFRWKKHLKVIAVEELARKVNGVASCDTLQSDILRKVYSPYMITFYGAIIERNLSMVMELCERGSLYDVLKKNPKLGWDYLLRFARDMAEGIAVLHNLEEPIIHRDLKTLNLLVTKNWAVKVCDFGLSRSTSGNLETFKKLKGTLAYCAPEIFQGQVCTTRSDVFSMGICIWELMHCGVHHKHHDPYAEYGLTLDFQIIVQTALGLRPTIPIGCPIPVVEVYTSCILPDASQRASAREVADHLAKIQDSFNQDKSAFLANTYQEEHRALYATESTSTFSSGNHHHHATTTSTVQTAPAQKFSGWGGGGGGRGKPATPSTAPPTPPSGDEPGFRGWSHKSAPEAMAFVKSDPAGGDGRGKRRDSKTPKPPGKH